jgi:hypothetical protein
VLFRSALTGAPASSDLSAERRVLRAVTYWPREALEWAEQEGLSLPLGENAPTRSDSAALAMVMPAAETPSTPIDGGASSELGPAQEPAGIVLTSPDPNSSYRIAPNLPRDFQQLEISALCASELAAQGVTLWVDDQSWHTWAAPPYRVLWPLVPGAHVFRVEGVDAKGHAVSSGALHIQVNTDIISTE